MSPHKNDVAKKKHENMSEIYGKMTMGKDAGLLWLFSNSLWQQEVLRALNSLSAVLSALNRDALSYVYYKSSIWLPRNVSLRQFQLLH